ncbi:hypothetical protein L484_009816 [Morus notabilis]|uniref:Uncharacterized protein n=1 Tax=Morus notabilis TaxID=981085 RepID=W9S4J1_9ROSA|nr:uncharacterized protein LOC21393133 [Morus notabilis]EXC25508.1 hypothetical protein L484_009816 [Morus notabilis]
MKKPGIFTASVAVASSATALTVASSSVQFSLQEDAILKRERENSSSSSERTPSTDKFAPRFDGLRFIETLVTAHR